ncbi:dipicolinic acid synthetase subunit A [Bacillus sp. 03113]|uniref:dipicolinic acid synthetase subunit A n=1 Tax=Bacillus sp. 03113 TaxID=2578211 RepID=UPI0011441474|nr:dipicolinic acid synthetase subunit A [Bacillus sp. 03113]
MLDEVTILLVGGDHRYIEVVKKLSQENAKIVLVGFDEITLDFPNTSKLEIHQVDFRTLDAILLPVSGVNPDGSVEAPFSSKEVFLTKELVSQTPDHCVLYSGISTPFLDKLVAETNRRLVRIFDRSDVAILNSIPTAEGALMLAIQNTDFTIHGSNVMVLGFGRVGMTIARVFSAVGAKVAVCVRKAMDAARITEMGLVPIFLDELKENISKMDIVINTIPRLVLSSNILAKAAEHTLILDLSSKPGGTDFEYAKKRNLKVIWALGLPGKIAPKTAGLIIGDVISKWLKDEN